MTPHQEALLEVLWCRRFGVPLKVGDLPKVCRGGPRFWDTAAAVRNRRAMSANGKRYAKVAP